MAAASALHVPTPSLPAATDPFASFLHIPAAVTIEADVISLTVRELFRLERGSIVTTSQPAGGNIPVHVAKSLIGWGEFQVFSDKLAVRLAELV